MCDNCRTKRGDLSKYQRNILPYRSYWLIEQKNWHDTGKIAVCSCGSSAFSADSLHEANSQSGGKWVMQCVGCKRLYILPKDKWEQVEIVPSVRIEGQS